MIGGVGSVVGQIGLLASMFAFSREHETRADRMGMRLMQQAGYDGREAAAVWDNLLAELKVTGGEEAGKRGDMFATHPTTAGRRDELLQLAGGAGGAPAPTTLPQGDRAAAPRLAAGRGQARPVRGKPGAVRPHAEAGCRRTAKCCTPAARSTACATTAATATRALADLDARQPLAEGAGARPSARWAWCTSSATTRPPPLQAFEKYLAQAPRGARCRHGAQPTWRS